MDIVDIVVELTKYSLIGLGCIIVATATFFVYILGKWKLRGAEISLKDRLYAGVPIIRYKESAFDIVCSLRRDQVKRFHVREEDVFLVTYPRSGTTRLQEVIFLIMSDLDFGQARNKIMDDRFPYLDAWYPGIKAIDAKPSPRLLKTHYPYQLLPTDVHKKKPKIVYCARNPKDVIVSQYYQACDFSFFRQPTIEDAFDSFMNGTGAFSPWWSHVLWFWQRRDDDNILFITYDDINQNSKECVNRLATFLGKTFSNEDVEKILDHCRIDNMRQNKSTNFGWLAEKNLFIRFMLGSKKTAMIRKGVSGGWSNHLTQEMSEAIDDLVEEKFQGTGLEFPQCRQKNKESSDT